MNRLKKETWIKIVIVLLIAILSVTLLSKHFSSVETYANTIESLDDKKETVMQLTAAATAASAAITLIPGDTGTPIAEKLADLSGYFLIVLTAIYLEKYLLTTLGFAAFKVLIPAACILYAIYAACGKQVLRTLAIKFALFGAAIVMVVPASVGISNMIESTYQKSIEETINSAQETANAISEETQDEEENNTAASKIKEWFSAVKEGASGAVQSVQNMLNRFIEALAVLIVTSCVIPILVIVFFVWLVKTIIGVNITLPTKRA